MGTQPPPPKGGGAPSLILRVAVENFEIGPALEQQIILVKTRSESV